MTACTASSTTNVAHQRSPEERGDMRDVAMKTGADFAPHHCRPVWEKQGNP
jgi:hypothetical protein